MKASKAVKLLILFLLVLQATCRSADASEGDVRATLAQSRDALLAQLKDIQRNYDDVSRQIYDLQKKQALLDSYRRETESAIAEVEQAMSQAH